MLTSMIVKQQKNLVFNASRALSSKNHHTDKPKRVIVTGAAGNIAYAILFRIARYLIYYY